MRIWLDACTGKHIRYTHAIAERLKKNGHETVLTTREHPDTIPLAKILNAEFEVVGRYESACLELRLNSNLQRQIHFLKEFGNDKPDLFISNQSVDGCRVAFGLGIPVITTADSPHAEKVNSLTIPLTDVLVTSASIPAKSYGKYGVERLVHFKGVDEVAWIQHFKSQGLFNPEFVVVRLTEKASYLAGVRKNLERFVKRLSAHLAYPKKILVMPRFKQAYVVDGGTSYPFEGYPDGLELVPKIGCFIGVGGTMSRENALLGIPSIVFAEFERDIGNRIEVNHFVRNTGFPLMFAQNEKEVVDLVEMYFGERFPTNQLLQGMENPLNVIEKEVEWLSREK